MFMIGEGIKNEMTFIITECAILVVKWKKLFYLHNIMKTLYSSLIWTIYQESTNQYTYLGISLNESFDFEPFNVKKNK